MVTPLKKLAVALALGGSVLLSASAAFAHHHHHYRYYPPYYGAAPYSRGYSAPSGVPYSGPGWYGQRPYGPPPGYWGWPHR